MRCGRLLICVLVAACAWAAQPASDSSPNAIFREIDGIVQQLEEITGLPIHHRVPAEMITRDKVKAFLEERIQEAAKPEEIRIEELTLKKFGLVPPDFDLKKNTVDLLTEQAAAFYDFHRKRLFITDWTPSATREAALIHELGHALADQNFNLEKYMKRGRKSDDGAIARLAVMEGQASWLMAEYLARQSGQSLASSPALLDSMAHMIESGAGQFPVFEKEPLYLRQTLVFPYTKGLLFQNAVYKRSGKRAFAEVFQHAPVSTQQILHPETYFEGVQPAHPALPPVSESHGYKRIAEGTVGELDHSILLEQYIGAEEASKMAPHWRGGNYALLERRSPERVILVYASEWDDGAAASRFFDLYRRVLAKKWKQMEVKSESESEVAGRGDDGYFLLRRAGATVTSMEGTENPAGAVN